MYSNVILGYYDQLRGTTCIVSTTGENDVNIEFTYEILSPIAVSSMIVYNGENRCKHLCTSNTPDTRQPNKPKISSSDKRPMDEE